MFRYKKGFDFSYMSCCNNFSRLCGFSPEEIKGKFESDMPWYNPTATICLTTDQMTVEKGSIEVCETIKAVDRWRVLRLHQEVIGNHICGLAVEITNLLEVDLLDTFTPETGLWTPYGDEILSVDDMALINARFYKWSQLKFKEYFHVDRRQQTRRENNLFRRFNVTNLPELIARLGDLRVMNAIAALTAHGFIPS